MQAPTGHLTVQQVGPSDPFVFGCSTPKISHSDPPWSNHWPLAVWILVPRPWVSRALFLVESIVLSFTTIRGFWARPSFVWPMDLPKAMCRIESLHFNVEDLERSNLVGTFFFEEYFYSSKSSCLLSLSSSLFTIILYPPLDFNLFLTSSLSILSSSSLSNTSSPQRLNRTGLPLKRHGSLRSLFKLQLGSDGNWPARGVRCPLGTNGSIIGC